MTSLAQPDAGTDQKQLALPKAISADSHTVEPPEAYSRHIDPAYRDRAPKLVHDAMKGDCYAIDGMPARISVISVSACGKRARPGKDADGNDVMLLEELDPPYPDGAHAERGTKAPAATIGAMTFDDIPRGGWQAAPRLEAQDRDGVVAEVLYPTFGMVLCNHPDSGYQNACFRAYNLWLQELVAEAPTRLFGIGQTALRSIDEGIEDLRRIKEMGFVGVMLPGDPDIAGEWHSPMFDPLWEAAQALELPLSFHTLASGRNKQDATKLLGQDRKDKINIGMDVIRANQDVMASFVMGRVFERFPRLKLVCVEAGAGWIPDFVHRMDHFYARHRGMYKMEEMQAVPSAQFFEHVYVTFQDDPVALSMTDKLNTSRLLWANDYPHSDATWPWSQNLLAEQMKPVPPEDRLRIMRTNARDLYHLPVD